MLLLNDSIHRINDDIFSILDSISSPIKSISTIAAVGVSSLLALFSIGFPWSNWSAKLSSSSSLYKILDFSILDPIVWQFVTIGILSILISIYHYRNAKPNIARAFSVILFTFVLVTGFLGVFWLLSEFVLKPIYSVDRPGITVRGWTDSILPGLVEKSDLPSGFALRQAILLNGIVLVSLALGKVYKSLIPYLFIVFLIVVLISGWILFSRVMTGHHTIVALSAGLVWGVSLFWLILILFPFRSHLGFSEVHSGGLAIWTFLLLLAFSTQGNNVLGGMLGAFIMCAIWGVAHYIFSRKPSESIIRRNEKNFEE